MSEQEIKKKNSVKIENKSDKESPPGKAITGKKITDEEPRIHFDCNKCPAFCCSVYERVSVTMRDVKRLAKHFDVSAEDAERRFTKIHFGERVLRRKSDHLLGETCRFLDPVSRGCTVYEARPTVCRQYPERSRCAYYDLYQYEKRHQKDDTVIPVIRITFREEVEDGDDE